MRCTQLKVSNSVEVSKHTEISLNSALSIEIMRFGIF